MSMTERSSYSSIAIWLHWIIAILIIANIGIAELTEDLSREARGPYMDVHKAFGITVPVPVAGTTGLASGPQAPGIACGNAELAGSGLQKPAISCSIC